MKIKQNVKKAVNYLQSDYISGYINYPRVENNYIPSEKAHELVAHSPLKQRGGNYAPIANSELSFNKENALLFLNQERLLNPSMCLSYAEMIDEYFDDNLSLLPGKRTEIIELLGLLKIFLAEKLGIENLDEQERAVKNLSDQIYFNNQKSSMVFYEVKGIKFFQMSSTKKKREPLEVLESVWLKKYKDKKIKDKKDLLVRLDYLAECNTHFKQKTQDMQKRIEVQDEQINQITNATLNALEQRLNRI